MLLAAAAERLKAGKCEPAAGLSLTRATDYLFIMLLEWRGVSKFAFPKTLGGFWDFHPFIVERSAFKLEFCAPCVGIPLYVLWSGRVLFALYNSRALLVFMNRAYV
jgi:hypothetical protein